LLGVSYRPDVADTRHSPAEVFLDEIERRGATVILHDPLVRHWAERDRPVAPLPAALDGIDAVVFAVAHAEYRALDFSGWFAGLRPAVLDANNVLSEVQRAQLRRLDCRVAAIGRGGPL
jgi:UDP-N-acetyl-D-mannosaminuronate dehydrogenase